MRENVGSFIRLNNPDKIISEEMLRFNDRRQVVSILLLNPGNTAMCLCLADGARLDHKLNLSPLQGGIESGEKLYDAAKREIKEEVMLSTDIIIYLGSAIRDLPVGHRLSKQYKQFHHHWVYARATSSSLRAQPPLAEARWQYFDTLDSVSQVAMSKDKATMFKHACDMYFDFCDPRTLPIVGERVDKVA